LALKKQGSANRENGFYRLITGLINIKAKKGHPWV